MKNTEIHYSIGQVEQEMRRHKLADALNEFRTCYCDNMNMGDLRHYAGTTGKDVRWLLDHAKWRDPLGMFGVFLGNAVSDTDIDQVQALFINR